MGFRVAIIVAALTLALGWGWGNNLVTWEKPAYSCFDGRHIIAAGAPVTWMQIGNLQLKYQPYAFDCDKDHQYDPKRYVEVNGLLQPK